MPPARAVPTEEMVGYTEAIARALAMLRAPIRSNLKGSAKQFGWLQAPATKISFLSTISANPATIRICSPCVDYWLDPALRASVTTS
jgi:hypothetical protein